MSKFTDDRSSLVQNIVNGKLHKSKVDLEIKKIEEMYPEESFGYYVPERKDKPWDMTYLEELKELFYYGADSKEFILYMAEVSDAVYRSKRIKKAILSILLAIAVVTVAILVIKAMLGE